MYKELMKLIEAGDYFNEAYESQQEYFKETSHYLMAHGYVADDFYDALVAREKDYPTGLVTIATNVAIPHVSDLYVKKEGVIVTTFKSPIEFVNMENFDKKVPVELSFMLLIKNNEDHMEVLKQLISILQDSRVTNLIGLRDKTEFIDELLNIIKAKKEER